MKRFLEWIGLKEKLHHAKHRAPLVSERDVWWASIGENVGSEINGKSGAVLTTGVDPAEIGTRVLSRRTDEHTAPGGDVVCACPIKGSG